MITHLEMVTIYVTDQERALGYYRDALGFEVTHDMTWKENFRWLTVAPTGGETKLVLYKADLKMPEESSRVGQWTGLVFYTDDIAGTYQTLKGRGVHFSKEPEKMDWGGIEAQFVDPDGNRFELVENPARHQDRKIAAADYPIHRFLRLRWSPRAFSDRRIEPEKMMRLFEAARWAPSCFNEQPWSFIVGVKDQSADYDRLFSCLKEGNRRWAGSAPVLMLSVAKLNFDEGGKPNRHAIHDVGLAMENLVIQATALGLYVHQMAGFDVGKARELLTVPAGHEPVAAAALGYLGDPGGLPDALRERETAARERRPQHEFVFAGRWGEPPSWLKS